MSLNKGLLCIFALLLFSPSGFSQQWAGYLSSQRAIDWSSNGATIVNRTSQCGSTIAAYSGSAATINSALTACAGSNGYVQLAAGTFTLSSSIITSASNVTLRGMGPDQTFIVFTATSTNCNGVGGTSFCAWNGSSGSFQFPSSGNIANVTGTMTSGTTSLTFSNTTALAIGKIVIFTQNDDAADPGNIWVSQTNGFNGAASQQGGSGVAKAGAAQSQNVIVTNISGSTVTFTPGLYAPNWVSGKSPTGWWSNLAPLTGFGIEKLSLDYSNLGTKENGIEFHEAMGCWIKEVRSINSVASGGATHKHVNVYNSNHITVRDSYFYGASPTSEGYGVDFGPGSSNNLEENNIFQHLPTGRITETSCCNVFGYSYSVDNYYNNGAPNWQQQGEFHHGAGDYYNLFEGSQNVSGFDGDDIHGTSFFITHFREYLAGHDPTTTLPTAPKTQATFAYFPFANQRYYNIVGSVLGTQSYHTHYQNVPVTANPPDCTGANGDSAHSVFVFGFGDQAGSGYSPACLGSAFTIYNDPLVASSQMRWGNYAACTGDAACNAVRFQSSEDGSAAPVYPAISSPPTTLPNSFYYASQPAWWPAGFHWPPTGPDVTGGSGPNVGGHVYLNPAANCSLNVMGGSTNGSTGPLTFTPSACYTAAPPPTPFVQANGGQGASVAFGSNVTTGNALYAFVFCGTSSTCSIAVTSTHESGWTAPVYASIAADGDRLGISCALASGNQADTVSATGDGSGANIGWMLIYEMKGASCNLDATVSPSGGNVTNNSTQTTPISSGTITTTTANDFMFYYVGNAGFPGPVTWTAGSGFSNFICTDTAGYNASCVSSNDLRTAVQWKQLSTPGTTSSSITSSTGTSQEYGTIYVAFKPSGSGPSSPGNVFLMIR